MRRSTKYQSMVKVKSFCSRYFGFSQTTTPILFIRDTELIKQICIKDFDHFPEHQALATDGTIDPLWDKNLFASKGGFAEQRNHILLYDFSYKMEGVTSIAQSHIYKQQNETDVYPYGRMFSAIRRIF